MNLLAIYSSLLHDWKRLTGKKIKDYHPRTDLSYCTAHGYITAQPHSSDDYQTRCCLPIAIALVHPSYNFVSPVPGKRDPLQTYDIYYYCNAEWRQLQTERI